VISTVAVFVAALLATPATRQAIALALLFALVPIGLVMVGLLLYLAMIVSWGKNK
jgi:hypothetical protein